MEPATLELAHEDLLAEEKISAEDLPKKIRDKIQGFNLQKKKFEKSPTEKLANSLKISSVEIADMIQTEVVEKNAAPAPTPAAAAPAAPAAAPAAPAPAAAKSPEQIEAEIRSKIVNTNQILEKDVIDILGRRAKDIETFGKTKISKLAWSKYFRVYFL